MTKKICFIALSLLMMIWSSACKSTKDASGDYQTPYEYKGKMLTFGSGGGFTGKVENYTLMDNGQLFKGTMQEGNVNVYELDKDVVEQIFKNYVTLGFDKMNLDNPGNLYYFIIMEEGEEEHKLKWGGYGDEKPELLHLYYRNLYQLARRASAPRSELPEVTR